MALRREKTEQGVCPGRRQEDGGQRLDDIEAFVAVWFRGRMRRDVERIAPPDPNTSLASAVRPDR
jgi:hypothetical protein